MNDYRHSIMQILFEEGTMIWEDLVSRFPDEAIDSDLPAAVSYLREYGYVEWEEVHDEREFLISWKKGLENG